MSPAARRAWTPVLVAAFGVACQINAHSSGTYMPSQDGFGVGCILAAAMLGIARTRRFLAEWYIMVGLITMGIGAVAGGVLILLGPPDPRFRDALAFLAIAAGSIPIAFLIAMMLDPSLRAERRTALQTYDAGSPGETP